MKFKIFSILFFILFSGLYAQQENPEVTIEELKEHIYFLASEKLAGREPGTEGSKLAAEYIREQLSQSGDLLFDNGFQKFQLTDGYEIGEKNKFVLDNFEARLNTDFIPFSVSIDTTITAEIVFAGYGFDIDETNNKWNDFEKIDVKDKWVLILRGSPDDQNKVFENHSSLRKKVLNAKDKKAAGVIFVNGPEFNAKDELVEFSKSDIGIGGLPVVQIKRELADKILELEDITINDLEGHFINEQTPYSFNTGVQVEISTDIDAIHIPAVNVAAVIKGSDEKLKDEYIVIGGHFDHLGMGGHGTGSRVPDTSAIHFGADDNASGTTAVIEIFEKLAAQKSNLKRSVIAVLFDAEETGLNGSKYFTANPPVELNKIKAMLNIDMLGRYEKDKGITVGGIGTAAELENIVNKYNESEQINIKTSQEGYGPSDHASFYANDIPVLFFFTGAHEDYHTPRDTPDKINYESEKMLSDYIFDIAFEITNLDTAMKFKEAGPKDGGQKARPKFKVSLGIMPDVSGSGDDGLRVDAVINNRPAKEGGMEKGDKIISINGKKVSNIYDYMERLAEFKPGQEIDVIVIRDDKKITLKIKL